MHGTRLVGMILLVGGILALAYGGFSYTRTEKAAEIGPISLDVKSKERVNIPLWAGVVGVVLGGVMLMAPGKRV